MTQSADQPSTPESLRKRIRVAFPDLVFPGPITPADSEIGEEFDEDRALYEALHGKRWSEIPDSFIKPYAYSLPLLTEGAFGMFLPAWLLSALDDREVRRAVVYTFSKQRGEDTSFMDARVLPLNGAQKETIRAFLAHALDIEPSKSVQVHARDALEYIGRLT